MANLLPGVPQVAQLLRRAAVALEAGPSSDLSERQAAFDAGVLAVARRIADALAPLLAADVAGIEAATANHVADAGKKVSAADHFGGANKMVEAPKVEAIGQNAKEASDGCHE